MSNELIWMDNAAKAIAKVSTPIEAKTIADKAAAIKQYAIRQNWSVEQRAEISEIEINAVVRLGELLKDMPGIKPGPINSTGELIRLSDIGVSPKLSHKAQLAASVPADQRSEWIARNKVGCKLSVTGLVRLARQSKIQEQRASVENETSTSDSMQHLIDYGKKFGTIYADPPWQYGNQGTRAATDNHYSTMSIDQIAALPVGELAAEQSHLHLWTTNGFLKEALSLIETWGFEFKSTFVWVKPQLGIGNYWRCSHEIMLLGVKGGLTFPPSNTKSWIELPRTKHSAKPKEIRKLIEGVSPGPRLELFSRTISEGWVSWGNEIERGMFDADVPHNAAGEK